MQPLKPSLQRIKGFASIMGRKKQVKFKLGSQLATTVVVERVQYQATEDSDEEEVPCACTCVIV